MNEWTWAYTGGESDGSAGFPTQADAEAWLSQSWEELADAGVSAVTLRQGDALLMEMEGGISISENPVFRLGYTPDGAPVTIHAEDTEDRQFDASFPGSGG